MEPLTQDPSVDPAASPPEEGAGEVEPQAPSEPPEPEAPSVEELQAQIKQRDEDLATAQKRLSDTQRSWQQAQEELRFRGFVQDELSRRVPGQDPQAQEVKWNPIEYDEPDNLLEDGKRLLGFLDEKLQEAVEFGRRKTLQDIAPFLQSAAYMDGIVPHVIRSEYKKAKDDARKMIGEELASYNQPDDFDEYLPSIEEVFRRTPNGAAISLDPRQWRGAYWMLRNSGGARQPVRQVPEPPRSVGPTQPTPQKVQADEGDPMRNLPPYIREQIPRVAERLGRDPKELAKRYLDQQKTKRKRATP